MNTARFVMQVFGWAVGIPLEILVIFALLRNGYRRYPIVFLYLLVNFATTLVDIPIFTHSFLANDAPGRRLAAQVYWFNEWVLQVLIFATVLSLIDHAISLSRLRQRMRAGLATGAVLFAGITFWVHYLPPPAEVGVWMTPWTSELSLCATFLDVALWMILIASRKSDRVLLLICGALGIAVHSGSHRGADRYHRRPATFAAAGFGRVGSGRRRESDLPLCLVADFSNLARTCPTTKRAVEVSPYGSSLRRQCAACERYCSCLLAVVAVPESTSAVNTFTSTRRFLARAARSLPSSTGFSCPRPIMWMR